MFSFIQEIILRKSEWGTIKLKRDGVKIDKLRLMYKYGEIKSSNIPSVLLKSKILNVTCYGGYTLMDYIVEVEKDDFILKEI